MGKFFIIGLGLGDEKDITLKGLEAIKQCEYLFLEAYTSILAVDKERLEELYGKKVIVADREMIENECDELILEKAKTTNVALLVVGDPFGATTHADIVIRAKKMGIEVQVVHNASIMNACGACGLQLYRFGETISIVFFTDEWRPDSFYDKIAANKKMGLHTLCLLDIKVKEQSMENLLRGRKIYEPPRFMSINLALKQLLEIEEKRKLGVCTKDALAIGLARIGTDTQQIVAGTIEELLDVDFGKPLHSLILAGELHMIEEEILDYYMLPNSKLKKKEKVDENIDFKKLLK